MAKMNDNCVFISARKGTNIDELKQRLYSMAREIHLSRFPLQRPPLPNLRRRIKGIDNWQQPIEQHKTPPPEATLRGRIASESYSLADGYFLPLAI